VEELERVRRGPPAGRPRCGRGYFRSGLLLPGWHGVGLAWRDL